MTELQNIVQLTDAEINTFQLLPFLFSFVCFCLFLGSHCSCCIETNGTENILVGGGATANEWRRKKKKLPSKCMFVAGCRLLLNRENYFLVLQVTTSLRGYADQTGINSVRLHWLLLSIFNLDNRPRVGNLSLSFFCKYPVPSVDPLLPSRGVPEVPNFGRRLLKQEIIYNPRGNLSRTAALGNCSFGRHSICCHNIAAQSQKTAWANLGHFSSVSPSPTPGALSVRSTVVSWRQTALRGFDNLTCAEVWQMAFRGCADCSSHR